MRGTQHNRYPKVWYNTEQRCRSTIYAYPRNRGVVAQCKSVVTLTESVEALNRECRRTNQRCLFIHYSVLSNNTIICVSKHFIFLTHIFVLG